MPIYQLPRQSRAQRPLEQKGAANELQCESLQNFEKYKHEQLQFPKVSGQASTEA